MSNSNERLIWCDVETTGLDPKKDLLLEVAMVITDRNLEVLETLSYVLYHEYRQLRRYLKPDTLKMHNDNGLITEVQQSSIELSVAQRGFAALMQNQGVQVGKGILAGSSVHFDRAFLQEHMPLLEVFFYHRMFDTSAFKTAAQMWRPDFMPNLEKPKHRAMDDILGSIALARHFRDKCFGEQT